jgi:hypothetical protein
MEETPHKDHPHKTVHHHKKPMPPTYLWQSIAVTVMCCNPLGILAIIFATRVQSRWIKKDYEGAFYASRIARNIAFWTFIIGIFTHIMILIYVVFVIGLLSGGILGHYFS